MRASWFLRSARILMEARAAVEVPPGWDLRTGSSLMLGGFQPDGSPLWAYQGSMEGESWLKRLQAIATNLTRARDKWVEVAKSDAPTRDGARALVFADGTLVYPFRLTGEEVEADRRYRKIRLIPFPGSKDRMDMEGIYHEILTESVLGHSPEELLFPAVDAANRVLSESVGVPGIEASDLTSFHASRLVWTRLDEAEITGKVAARDLFQATSRWISRRIGVPMEEALERFVHPLVWESLRNYGVEVPDP